MGDLINFEEARDALESLSLHQLFDEAHRYGYVSLFEDRHTRTFHLKITFETSPGTTMEAKSDFGKESIADALIEATARARVMAAQFA